MRTGSGTGTTKLTYLLGDHLGSTSFTYRADTAATVTQLYTPWGESRYNSGTLPTKYTFTGQYSYMSSTELGLMFYKARWYDPALGRFAQADTLVPDAGNPMAFDRYSYTLNNPLRYTDPTGHASSEKEKVKQCRYKACQFWIALGVEFVGSWTSKEIAMVIKALNMIRNAMGIDAMRKALGLDKGLKLMGYTKAEWEETFCPSPDECTRGSHQSFYTGDANTIHFYQPQNSVNQVIHEIGHAVDYHAGGGTDYSTTPAWYGWEWHGVLISPGVRGQDKWLYVGEEDLVSTYAGTHPREDFAETFTAWVYEKNGQTYGNLIQPKHREALMAALSVFGVTQ